MIDAEVVAVENTMVLTFMPPARFTAEDDDKPVSSIKTKEISIFTYKVTTL